MLHKSDGDRFSGRDVGSEWIETVIEGFCKSWCIWFAEYKDLVKFTYSFNDEDDTYV